MSKHSIIYYLLSVIYYLLSVISFTDRVLP